MFFRGKWVFEILKFTSKEFVEHLGTKEKFWTRLKSKEYLFKIGRENTLENCSEKIAYEIAKLIQLEVAEYEFATYVNGYERQGVASKKFIENNARLILGNEILNMLIVNYDKNARNNELSSVLALMKLTESTNNFSGYLVFDALIGNQDRHHENWGFISSKSGLTLAPSFDHASGLASKVSEQEAKNRLTTQDVNYKVSHFCKKAITPFYKNGKKLKTFEVIAELCKIKDFAKHTFEWIEKIAEIKKDEFNKIMDKIPADFKLKDANMELIVAMLEENINNLLELRQKQ